MKGISVPETKNVGNQMHLCIFRVLHNAGSFQHTPDKMHLKKCEAQQAYNLHAEAIDMDYSWTADDAEVSNRTCSFEKPVEASPGHAADSRALLQAVPAT